MSGIRTSRALLASAAALVLMSGPVDAAEDFYKGKAVKIIINLAAGGTLSIQSELFARYWKKHVPGNPDFVVQPMAGGGNTKGIDYVMNSARPDGLTVGWLGSSASTRIVGPKSQQIDWSPLYDTVIGANGSGTVMYARKDIAPGLTTATDIKNAKEIVLGGQDPSSRLDTAGRLAFEMLGIDYRYVTGYKGGAPINAALLRNEISVHVTPPGAYLARYVDNAIKSDIAIPLWYFAAYRSDGTAVEFPELVGVKSFKEVYQEIKGAPPSGKIWEALKFIADVTEFTSSLVVAPPGTPADRVAILRQGFMKTSQDREYLEAATKQDGMAPTFANAEQVRATLKGLASADPEMLAIIKKNIETYSTR